VQDITKPENVDTMTVEELREALKALVRWTLKRGHALHCWGREDEAQCVCGLREALRRPK
jgi:hypothetical protein